MIIKVCGMRDAENIRQVEQIGADWMGFIDYEKSPRYVDGIPEYLPKSLKESAFCSGTIFKNKGKDRRVAAKYCTTSWK